MSKLVIHASTLQGILHVPPSKSHTLRALLFASLANGTSHLKNLLPSPDTEAMMMACRQFGATIKVEGTSATVEGVNGKPQLPCDVIDAGNSGQVLRFVGSVVALIEGYSVLTGDASVRFNRPVQPLLEAVTALGGQGLSTKGDGHAPVIIQGPIQAGRCCIDGQDSQPVSGLLMASAFLEGTTVIDVKNPGEQPWIELTLSWLDRMGVSYQREGYTRYEVAGPVQIRAFDYTVPGDFSAMAYPVVAALITNSSLMITGLDWNDVQGDRHILEVLESMGAHFSYHKTALEVHAGASFNGVRVDMNACIDALPILAVMGCFCQGETVLYNARIARKKESDRLHAIATQLNTMGAQVTEAEDALTIQGGTGLHGVCVSSFDDHRIAMALAVAGLAAEGITCIEKTQCIAKSYPDFADAMQHIGARMGEQQCD